MYISSLRIERFGVWADLRLNGFSEGLNVIYGPNGSGKTTVVRFIGATLYGFDGEIRSRYLSAGVNGGGSLTVQGPFGRRTVLRHDEGPARDRLLVEHADAAVGGLYQLQDLLGGVRQAAFDRLFHVEFEGDLDADKLVQTALAEGFDLLGGHADTERAAELRERLQSKRQALAEIATADIAFDELVRRRRSLQQETESLQVSFQDRRAAWERRLRQLDENIADLEEQWEGLDSELKSVTAQIEARQADKRGREAALRDAQQRQFQLDSQRRDALCQIDAQLERWRQVLRDLEDRNRQLRDQAGLQPGPDARTEADPRRYLRRLEDRVDQLQKSVAALTAAAEPGRCQCVELRSALQPALAAIRGDLYRLCNGLSDWELRSQQRDTHSELGQIQRCEGELRSALAGLSLQRQTLLAELAAETDGDRLALHPDHVALCTCQEHPHSLDAAPRPNDAPLPDETLLAWEAELRRLLARQSHLQDDLETMDRELRDQRRQVALECDPEFEAHQLKAKRQELEDIEVSLRQFERRRELMSAITKLEEELRELTSPVRTPALLLEASDLLRRLTDGDLQKLTVNADRSVCIDNRRGERLAYSQLNSGGRDQVYLSLCLAVVAAYARRGTRLPLLINDAFGNLDAQGVAAAAALLSDFCRGGHQVLLFTRHQHVADRFCSLDVPVRQLPPLDRVQVALPAEEPVSVSSLNEINRQLNAIAAELDAPPQTFERRAWNSEEFPGELTDRVRARSPEPSRESEVLDAASAAEYFLLESSPIQEAPSIDAATAERFRKIGVLLVRDLLRLDVVEAADRLRYAGITGPMIRRWQAESLLACRIPRLRPYDARILVACGITTPDQLARLEAEELLRRVEHFAATSTGAVLLRAGNRYELSRLMEWIHAARRDRQRSRAASEASPRPLRAPRDDDRRTQTVAARSQRESRSRSATPKPAVRPETPSPVVLKMEAGAAPQRFYLELSDSIEQAPSIGPRMAQRLEAVGIRTVADFLQADPASTATRLDRKSVDAQVIRAWQQQAALVCRVPWLRGHDAQILVACGVTDPESLAKLDAATFWNTVQPVAQSAEGKRMLRTSKAPDLEEVTHWIQWAGQARTLRAA